MIKIIIKTNGEKIFDSFETEKTTLLENALVIRRLEELKNKLLRFEYKSELEVSDDTEEGGEEEK